MKNYAAILLATSWNEVQKSVLKYMCLIEIFVDVCRPKLAIIGDFFHNFKYIIRIINTCVANGKACLWKQK